MKILICSDGTPSAQTAIDLVGLLAGPLTAETTLLGIAEKSEDEQPLRQALDAQAQSLRQRSVSPDIVVQFGEPVLQIVQQTSKSKYDLVVIGARWTGAVGHYWRSKRTYEVIKAIQPPVLVAIGERKELKRFVVCTGGKEFIEQAVKFTGQLAAAVRASVTLLHVMAEPPRCMPTSYEWKKMSISYSNRNPSSEPICAGKNGNSTAWASPLKCISGTAL